MKNDTCVLIELKKIKKDQNCKTQKHITPRFFPSSFSYLSIEKSPFLFSSYIPDPKFMPTYPKILEPRNFRIFW